MAPGVVAYASQFQGVPYVYGGTTPSGFDCSGFTQYVYSKFGISLPRIDYQQRVWAQAHGTKVSDPQPGDLMWRSGHVGIYVGNGLMIHAPRPGKSVSHRARIRFLRVLPNHLSRLLRVEESSNDISHCTAPPLGRCRAFSTGDAATMPCPLPLRCRAL